MLLRSLSFASALCVALLAGCASPVAHDGAADLVPVAQWAPDVVQDMRYFGAENFMGRPVAGYEAPQCWLSRPAAQALVDVRIDAQQKVYPMVPPGAANTEMVGE